MRYSNSMIEITTQLWKVNSSQKGQEFLVELNDHNSVVNCARFSPCGKMLATASDRQIIIYTGQKSYFDLPICVA